MSEPTCWTMLEDAASGRADARDAFARRYAEVSRAYFLKRWGGTPHAADVDDAVQEVMMACLQPGGLVERAERTRETGFRAFLYGLLRNVAARTEEKRRREGEQRAGEPPSFLAADDTKLSAAFDREWARALVREAADALAVQSTSEAARRRYDVLRLRFQEGLSLADVAGRLGLEPAKVHEDYAVARREFEAVFVRTVAFHHPSTPGEIRRECAELLELL